MAQDFEKQGVFYLGRKLDPTTLAAREDLLLYDAKDLTTHGVIVGMTGSGKTGLGIALLEEAALDGIPAIVIDPKGDLGNLMLAFPELRAQDFRPWIDEAEAGRKGVTPDVLAQQTAETWKKGLADWGQDGARIARYAGACETTIYTPGSGAGVPLAILRSFAAPPPAVRDDGEALRERVLTTTSSLLGLVGVDADPVKSREHVLISTLLTKAWGEGRDLDVGALIREIQAPPLTQIGVLDLEAFYPQKERYALAMSLNALLASPGFAAWTTGEPLDVARLLYTKDGRPRLSILSIAHLSDAERMFFVSTLLNEVVAWVRQQSGTSSLRALLYMDEVFGFFPPSANPPSKLPMLTLLKQARAFGLGVVLATQNPVDLDYKGLGNCGTWFLGRLQTDRDKLRVLDGLQNAAAAATSFDRAAYDRMLSGLKPRTFLMVNAKDDHPTPLTTRWVLSYLRGPLTRAQIVTLKDRMPAAKAYAEATARAQASGADGGAAAGGGASPAARGGAGGGGGGGGGARPILAAGVAELFLPWRGSLSGARLEYRPSIHGAVKAHYVEAKSGVDVWEDLHVTAPVPDETASDPWDGATVTEGTAPDVEKEPAAGASFASAPGFVGRPKTFPAWQKALEEHVYRTRSVALWKAPALKQTSTPGETEAAFRERLTAGAKAQRDAKVFELKKRYAPKVATLEDRIRTAAGRVEREKEQAKQSKWAAFLAFLMAILTAFTGRKKLSSSTVTRAGTAMRGASKTAKESQDVARAEESAEVLAQRLKDLQAEIAAETAQLDAAADPASLALEAVKVAPRKGDIAAGPVALLWVPWRVRPDGTAEPAA